MTIAPSHGPGPAGPDPASRPSVPVQAVWGDDDTPWEEDAACRGTDPELFFPVSTTGPSIEQIRQAKAVCARCPVRQPCLAYALATGQDFGIWGGCDEAERRALRRAIPRPRAAGPQHTVSDRRPAADDAAAAARPGNSAAR